MEQEIIKINSQGVITIPASFRKKGGFAPNTFVSLTLEETGLMTLTPIDIIPRAQALFHTDVWKEKEKQATLDLKKGKVKSYKDPKTFIKEIDQW